MTYEVGFTTAVVFSNGVIVPGLSTLLISSPFSVIRNGNERCIEFISTSKQFRLRYNILK